MNTNILKEFSRHVSSYFFIIFIPIVLLNIYYQNYFLDLYKGEIISQSSNNLNKLQLNFDYKIDLIHKVSLELMSNACFSNAYISNNVTAFYHIFNELNAAKRLDPAFLDIYYYNKVTPHTLYSCSGTYNPETYSKINPQFLGQYTNFQDKLNTIETPQFYAHSFNIFLSDKPAIEYIIPIHNQAAFFIFRIDPNFFEDTLNNMSTPNATFYTYILADNIMLYSNAPSAHSLSLEALPPLDSFSLQTTYQNEYYISQIASPSTHLTYVSIIDEDLLLGKVKMLSQKFILLNAFILLIGFMITFLLTHRYYKPIRKLLYSLDQFNFNLPNHLHTLDKVAMGMNLLEHDNKRLHYEKCLLKLLGGTYKDIYTFNISAQPYGITLHHETFKVITLSALPTYTFNEKDILFLQETKVLPMDFVDFHYLHHVSHNMYVFIAFYENTDARTLKEGLITLQGTLSATLSIPFALCISSAYKDLSAIPYALLECSKLTQDTSSLHTNAPAFYEETCLGHSSHFYYPENELSGLQDAITSYNLEKVEFFIHTLIDYIQQLHDYHPLLLPLVYSVSHTLKKGAKALNITLNPSLDIPLSPAHSLSKTYFIDYIHTLTKEITAVIQLHTAPSSSLSIQTIMAYIDQHYCEYDLSVSSLADHFNLSVSNLSHQFKTATGVNLSTYINSLRIEQAKTLLCTTSMTVSEISTTIGYTQPSSFIRRFKQFTDLTPGEFRTQKGN